ncbi:hypothetical protein ACLOJK_012638 [Asimina triloba]
MAACSIQIRQPHPSPTDDPNDNILVKFGDDMPKSTARSATHLHLNDTVTAQPTALNHIPPHHDINMDNFTPIKGHQLVDREKSSSEHLPLAQGRMNDQMEGAVGAEGNNKRIEGNKASAREIGRGVWAIAHFGSGRPNAVKMIHY